MKIFYPAIPLLVGLLVLIGCSNEPGEYVEDPRAYLMEKFMTMEHNAW